MNGDSTNRESHLPEETVATVANDYGGSQFAYPLSVVSNSMSESNGLTKRELLAAMAMQGMLSDEAGDGTSQYSPWNCAKRAVEFADALLKELAK